MRAASFSSCSAVPPTTPFTLRVSSWLPQDTILSASTPTFTETAKCAWAFWGKAYFSIYSPFIWPDKTQRDQHIVGNPSSYYVSPNKYFLLNCCRTWTGPAWSPAQSISSVLISIQSLMTENPYHNEPGFEQVWVWPSTMNRTHNDNHSVNADTFQLQGAFFATFTREQ